MRLVHEYEERQEKALQKQADTYENVSELNANLTGILMISFGGEFRWLDL